MTKEIHEWQMIDLEKVDKPKSEYSKQERKRDLWEKIKNNEIQSKSNREVGEIYGVSRETIRLEKNQIIEETDIKEMVDEMLWKDFNHDRKNSEERMLTWKRLSQVLKNLGITAEKQIVEEAEEIEDGEITVSWEEKE